MIIIVPNNSNFLKKRVDVYSDIKMLRNADLQQQYKFYVQQSHYMPTYYIEKSYRISWFALSLKHI